ncbi:UNVERIFIED_CONTAM: hypothetical protein K2H54_069743 [Gekko kuhli]
MGYSPQFTRYSCSKCGRSGEARDANYRYRLSLEVADAHGVFLVTVFGSCLEAFFGVTAKSLQRYIEDLNPEAGEAARDASPSVVIQAVETCFIGKKFIFGVKDSTKQDGAGRLQSNSEAGHCPTALTACQMFAPNPGLVGCTVLRYLRQHRRSSGSKGGHGGGWSPGGLFAALSQPSSELSSLRGSGDGDGVPSTQALWPQSFGLTSSSVSRGTAADPAAFDWRGAACDEQKWDNSPVSLQRRNQSIDNSQDNNRTVNERNVQEGDKFCLRPTWHSGIFVAKEAQSHSSEREGYKPLQTGKKDSPGEISIQHSRGREKSRNSLQGCSCCPLVPCAGRSRDGRSSQDGPWFWDELPSSESLNEFIARIENGDATVSPTETRVWRNFPSKGAGEIHGCVSQTAPQLGATSTTGQAREKLQEVAEKVDVPREPVLSCHQSSQLSLSGKEYQQEASFSTLSTQGKDEWERLSDHHWLLSPQLSPVGIRPSGSKGSCPSPKEGVARDVTGHENCRASASLKAARNCLKSPARLNRECEDNATGRGKEESSHSEPKQAVCEKLDQVCEGPPPPEMHRNHCEEGEISSWLRASSTCPQGSYNASADLFDASAAGTEVIIGTLITGQAFSAQGGALTAKSAASGCKPSESEASWNTSRSGLSILDLFAASDLTASTPVAGLTFELECSPSSSQDFVPSSQSTPCVRPWQQGKESVLGKLPLKELPWIDAKWKRPRPASKGPLVKQLISKFLKSRRSSDVSSAARDTSVTPGLFVSGSPAQELSESDGAEWIPPSEKRWRQPLPFQNQKTFGSRRSWDIMGKTPFSDKRRRRETPRGTIALSRTEFSPGNQRPAGVNEDAADPEQVTVASPGFCRPHLSSATCSTPNTASWSPELFGDNSQLPHPGSRSVKSPTSNVSFLLKRALFRPSWSHFR